jgi:tetratricopeptide (TPR) repeat protein
MSTSQVAPVQSPIRVFVSYSPQSMRSEGTALISELERHGAAVSSGDPSLGENWSKVIADAITNADLLIVLINPGDELRKFMQYETRLMLQNGWERPAVRIAVIAPAVGAIPRALRHQPFVIYYPHDAVGLDRWGSDSSLDNFVSQLLGPRPDTGHEPLKPFSDAEIHEWRNNIVHSGSSTIMDDAEQRLQLRQKLLDDLVRFRTLIDEAEATRTRIDRKETENVFDRIVLARAIGDDKLTAEYYQVVQRIYDMNPPTSPAQEAGFQYGFGLATLGAGDLDTARELLEEATGTNERVLGRDHPATVAARYNLGLTYAQLGDEASAIETFENALSSAIESLGTRHPQTAEIAYNLGLVRKNQGDLQSARELFQLASEAYRHVRPDDSPELQLVLDQLASLESADR